MQQLNCSPTCSDLLGHEVEVDDEGRPLAQHYTHFSEHVVGRREVDVRTGELVVAVVVAHDVDDRNLSAGEYRGIAQALNEASAWLDLVRSQQVEKVAR